MTEGHFPEMEKLVGTKMGSVKILGFIIPLGKTHTYKCVCECGRTTYVTEKYMGNPDFLMCADCRRLKRNGN